jgi:hypothetical protein
MKETDILLRRAEKLRRDALSVRRDATRLSLQSDQQRMREVANSLEADARELEGRAWRRINLLQTAPSPSKPQRSLAGSTLPAAE